MGINYYKISLNGKVFYKKTNNDLLKFSSKERKIEETTKEIYEQEVLSFYVVYIKDTNEIIKFIKTKLNIEQARKKYVFSDTKDIKVINRDNYYLNNKTFLNKDPRIVNKINNQKEIDEKQTIYNLQTALDYKEEDKVRVPEPKIENYKYNLITSRKTLSDIGL